MDAVPNPSYASYDLFDPEAYLDSRYKDVTAKDRVQFLLDGCNEAFQSLPHSLKILDYGCGPVIQHSISAAAHASEIVFCDIVDKSCLAIKKWLEKDPTAFNWSPHFDYVVQTLEGKGEEEAREREETLRKVAKGVVHCDVLATPPIEKGFEGPYDVLIEGGVLATSGPNLESFKKGLLALKGLLKPGGTIVKWGADITMDKPSVPYFVGDKKFRCLTTDMVFVESAFVEAGFNAIKIKYRSVDPDNDNRYAETPGLKGYFVLTAVRGERA